MGSKKKKLPQTTGQLRQITAAPQLASNESVFTDRTRNFEWDSRVKSEAAELQEHMTDNPKVLEERYYIGYPQERLQELSLALSKVVDKDDFLFGDMPSIDISRIYLHYNRECLGNEQRLPDYQADGAEQALQISEVRNAKYVYKGISADDIKDFIDSRYQLVLEEGYAVSELEVYTIAFENALKLLQNQSNAGQLTDLLNSIKNYYINKVTRKGQRMKALELANQELDGKVILLYQDQELLRSELQAKDHALGDAQEQNKQLSDKIFELFAEKNRLSKTLEELQQRLGQYERSAQLLKTENEELTQQQYQLNYRIKHITAVSQRLRQVSDYSLEKLHISEYKLYESTSELVKMQNRYKAQETYIVGYIEQNQGLLNQLSSERTEFERQRVQYLQKLYKYGEAPDQFDQKFNYNLKEAIQTAVILASEDAAGALKKLSIAPSGLHSLRVVLYNLNTAGSVQEILRGFYKDYYDVLQAYSKEVQTVGYSARQSYNYAQSHTYSYTTGQTGSNQAAYGGYKRQYHTPRARLTPRGAERTENQAYNILRAELSNASEAGELSGEGFEAVKSPQSASGQLDFVGLAANANMPRFQPPSNALALYKPKYQYKLQTPRTMHKQAPATQSKAEISEAYGSQYGHVTGERAQSPDSCGDMGAEVAKKEPVHMKRGSVLQCDSARKSRSAASDSSRQAETPRVASPYVAISAGTTTPGVKKQIKTHKSSPKKEKLQRHNSLSSEYMPQCQSMPRLEVLELRDGVYYLSYAAYRSYQQRMQNAGILVNKQMYYTVQLQIAQPAANVLENLCTDTGVFYDTAQKLPERRCETADFGVYANVQANELAFLRFKVNELTRRCYDAGLLPAEEDIYKDVGYDIYTLGAALKSQAHLLQPYITRMTTSDLVKAAEQQKVLAANEYYESKNRDAVASADAFAAFYTLGSASSSFSGSSLSIQSFYHAEAADPQLLKYVKNIATEKGVQAAVQQCSGYCQTERDIGDQIQFVWDYPELDPADLASFSVARQLAEGTNQEREIEVFKAPEVAVAVDGLKIVEIPLLGGFYRTETVDKRGSGSLAGVMTAECDAYNASKEQGRFNGYTAGFQAYWDSRRASATGSKYILADGVTGLETQLYDSQQLQIRDAADIPTFSEFFASAERRPVFAYVTPQNDVLQALRRQRRLAALQDELNLQSAHFYLGIEDRVGLSQNSGIIYYKYQNMLSNSANSAAQRAPQTSRLKATATAYVRADAQKCGPERPLVYQKANLPTIYDYYAQIAASAHGSAARITVAAAVQPSFMLLHPRASASVAEQLNYSQVDSRGLELDSAAATYQNSIQSGRESQNGGQNGQNMLKQNQQGYSASDQATQRPLRADEFYSHGPPLGQSYAGAPDYPHYNALSYLPSNAPNYYAPGPDAAYCNDFPAPRSAEAFRIAHALDRVYFKYAPGRANGYLFVFPPCLAAYPFEKLFAPTSSCLAGAAAEFYAEAASVGLRVANAAVGPPGRGRASLAPTVGGAVGYVRLSAMRCCGGGDKNESNQPPSVLDRLQTLARRPLAVLQIESQYYVYVPLQNVVVKPINSVIRLARQLLADHARASVAALQLAHYAPGNGVCERPRELLTVQPGDLRRAQAENLAEFVFFWARRRYGVGVLVEAFVWGLAANLLQYQYQNDELYLFARFFFDELDADHFLLYQALRNCLSLPIPQIPTPANNNTNAGGAQKGIIPYNSGDGGNYRDDNSAAPELVLIALLPALAYTLLPAWEPPRQRALLQSVYAAVYNQARGAQRPPTAMPFPLLAALCLSAYDGYRKTCFQAVQFVYQKIAREEHTLPALSFAGFYYLMRAVLPAAGAQLTSEMFCAFSSTTDGRAQYNSSDGNNSGITAIGITGAAERPESARSSGYCGINARDRAVEATESAQRGLMSFAQFQDLFRSFQFARFARVAPEALDGLAGLPLKRLVRNLVLVFNNYQTVEQGALALLQVPTGDGDAHGRLARLKNAVYDDLLAYDLQAAARNFAALVQEIEACCAECRPECTLCMLGGAVNGLRAFVNDAHALPERE